MILDRIVHFIIDIAYKATKSQPVSQSASQPVSQSASQPVSQSASQPVSAIRIYIHF
ncbi:hypothetical protein [Legionella pneumophila]|uniref:hypothetical protein n=1 Tax=Legionella pneumophila TaxID=446 RepID=UPI0007707A0F|nr:hypothetical protein [Legionella pneumophila]CZH09625.1 Uncharacterised protein [Legionella pneumophila]CZH44289.1 Uncharacterised protein [Legionella pneumophila]CZH46010.1 Uncharacterised protein [Legionella pneumophila]